MNPVNWTFAGNLNWSGKTKDGPERGLSSDLTAPLIQLECLTRATGKLPTPSTWYRAGWIKQYSLGGALVLSRVAPLGKLLFFPNTEITPYRLRFFPVHWLPNLTVKIETLTGVYLPPDQQIDAIADTLGVGLDDYGLDFTPHSVTDASYG